MLKLRQYFCRHDFKFIIKHNSASQNLWHCPKCKVYCIQHWGIGVSYKTNNPNAWLKTIK